MLSLAAKVQVLAPVDAPVILLLVRHVFNLARYDEDYDVRDRARMLSSLLIGLHQNVSAGEGETYDDVLANRGGVVLRREQVKLVLFEGKIGSTVQKPSYSEWPSLLLSKELNYYSSDNYNIFGTLSTVTGKSAGLDSWLVLPEWAEEGTESFLRDTPDEFPTRPVASLSSQQVPSSAVIHHTPQVLLRSSTPPSGRASPAGQATGSSASKRWANLDDFLNEEEPSPSEEENSDDSSSTDESEEEEAEGSNNLRSTTVGVTPRSTTGGRVESEGETDSDDTGSTDDSGSSE